MLDSPSQLDSCRWRESCRPQLGAAAVGSVLLLCAVAAAAAWLSSLAANSDQSELWNLDGLSLCASLSSEVVSLSSSVTAVSSESVPRQLVGLKKG